MKAEEIFDKAIQMTADEQRDAYVASACGTDAALLAKIQSLLKAHDEASQFLQQSLFESAPTVDQVPSEGPGTVIGPYKLLQEIGHGGMGVVFMAEQHQPVKRRVALKIIKPGMDSRQVIARFEAERQALSMMDHPNIARVLDAGTTTSGRPYFVMELVKGQPITKYCDEHHMTPRQRLELLLPVCQAIQHAHQKGIIHRDIKPSNILVAEYDSKPVPKVIDFGVAKAIHQPLTDKTMFTGFGNIVGTLEYMSPEQAKVNQLDIDTRSDIYSLGVLMYELLTGSTPFDRKRLKQAAWDEMLRIIREEEPQRPSTRISTTDELPSIAVNRGMEPKKLSSQVHGELDWIVMKALEKDRNRRYETANGFAMDLQRFLANEAVTACPPSAGYRFRKFVSRNKGKVLAGSTVLAALLFGILGTTWGMMQARAERDQKDLARQEEAKQRVLAETAVAAEKAAKLEADAKRQEAERNLAYAKKGNDILGSVFAGLNPKANYSTLAELRNALRDNLTKAVKELEDSSFGDPLAVADMQQTLGVSLNNLGEANLAIEILLKALAVRKERLGADHPNTLNTMGSLAQGYKASGKMDMALPLYEETLKLRTAKLGADHPDTLLSMNNLASSYLNIGKLDKALPLLEETLKLRTAKLGAEHPSTVTSMANLAEGYRAIGKMNKALPLLEEVLQLSISKLGADHPDTLTSMNNLALGYQNVGKLDKALPLLEECHKLSIARLGTDHPNTFTSLSNLAMGYQATGKLDKALPLLEESLQWRTAKLGADHPETLSSMGKLARGYQAINKLDKALPLLEETLKMRTAKLGADHPDTLNSMGYLAEGYWVARKLDKAMPLLEETYRLRTRKLGADHPTTLVAMNNLAEGYRVVGQLNKALPLYEESLKLSIAKFGAEHPDTLLAMNNLANGYWAVGNLDKATDMYEKTLKLCIANLGADHPNTLLCMGNLAGTYEAIGEMNKALPLLEERFKLSTAKLGTGHTDTLGSMKNLATHYLNTGQHEKALALSQQALKLRKAKHGPDHPATADCMALVGFTLLKLKKWTEAESNIRQALAIREKQQPDAWYTFNTRSLLGDALLGQKKFTDAEPLLLHGYEGMKGREQSIPMTAKAQLVRALDSLIQLYSETNKPEEVKKWQIEKDKRTWNRDKK